MLFDEGKILDDVRILDVGNKYGSMNTAANFYPKEMTLEQRQVEFLKKRQKLANINNFYYKKFFAANQETKDGSYRVLTSDLINEKDDGWQKDIIEDILIITKDNPGVVIGHPIADCPVIIMTDKKHGATALGHCSAELVDLGLPKQIFMALNKEFGTTPEDVKVYVSSCISDKWQYDRYPGFAKDKELWKDSIREVHSEENGIVYNIDIRKAIHSQFVELGIDDNSVYWNMDDTLTNPDYYSNSGARNDLSKSGRNFAGCYYPLDDSESKSKSK